VFATLLTAALPAIAWAQSPSSPASPGPSTAVQPAPATAAPSGAAPASPSPSVSSSPGPLWTPPAVSGPIALLTAGLEGDVRAVGIQEAFRDTLSEACPQATLDARAADTSELQAEQATSTLSAGARVLVIDPVDPAAAATLVTDARVAGAAVIALGESITGATPDLQVAYDEPASGSTIGAVVVQVAADAADAALTDDATPIPSDAPVERVVLVNGPDGDATLSAWSAKVREGLGARATIVHEVAVEDLTAPEGQRVIAEAIAAVTADGFGAVITPGDAVAAGVIAGLREAGIVPAERPVTGLGGSLPGTQAIVLGDQLLTTYAPWGQAARVAASLACGQATGVGLPDGLTTTPRDNGSGPVDTVLLTPIVVTQDGSVEGTRGVADTIVADEAFGPDTAATICTAELTQACEDLDIVIPSPSPVASATPAPGSPAASGPTPSPAASGPAGSPPASSLDGSPSADASPTG
jgi:D-xylose transport system substrate-binding protein